MDQLTKLFDAVRAITPHGEIRFKTGSADTWVCVVVVAGVILVETPAGTPREIVDAAIERLRGMSSRLKSVIDPDEL
jgi:hypothetical protein